MIQHLAVSYKKIWFGLIRDSKLSTSILDNILNMYIVCVADTWEKMMFNLMTESATEMIPKP